MKQAEIVGKTDRELFPADLADCCQKSDKETYKSRKPIYCEEQVTNANGDKIFFETIKSVICDENNNVLGLVGVSRDITKRKKAEEALGQSEEQFRLAFENAKDAIFWADPVSIL